MRRYIFMYALILFVAFSVSSCTSATDKKIANHATPDAKNFTSYAMGKPVGLYTLSNKNGMEVKITNIGARLVSVLAPDRNGRFADVVFGYNNADTYLKDNFYCGPIVGRYANRIAGGKFSIDGNQYQLPLNDGPNTLHGGPLGFHKVIWNAEQSGNTVVLSYLSPDGEQGFPGNLNVIVSYTLTDNNELKIGYLATTDQPTIVNLTSHAYWNMAGEGSDTINDQILTINASNYTPVDQTLIPTGEIDSVDDTPFDFRTGHAIGTNLNADDEQLKYGKGYDHNWVLDKLQNELSQAAVFYDPKSGRGMEIYTTEPGIQFYGGNFMDGTVIGKSGHAYKYRSGVALEPQHFPDSPNRENFPNTILRPGREYRETTIYKFIVK